jgi:hypothetical protein
VGNSQMRLSVPATRRLPRSLTTAEQATYLRVADTLCPGRGDAEDPSTYEELPQLLEVALTARSEAFAVIVGLLRQAETEADLGAWLRALHDADREGFQALSAVAAGAYLMVPAVQEAVGYPGQGRRVPTVDQAADELGDGILDPVLERGHFYVPTPPQAGPGIGATGRDARERRGDNGA